MFFRRVAMAAALSVLALHPALAEDANHRPLAGPPVLYPSKQGEDYRLAPAHPRDAKGKPIAGIPATRIDVKDVEGDWEENSDADLPPFAVAVPDGWRAQVQLYHANATGWLMVPRGWRVQRTAVGVDGNTVFSFVAADGAAAGWMTWTLYPACLGCIYTAAQGLFPGAHRQLDELMETSTPEPVLAPKPARLERLDRCTVRLAYARPQSLPVRALSVFDTDGDPLYREFSVAVPDASSALADFLLASFKAAHGGCGRS